MELFYEASEIQNLVFESKSVSLKSIAAKLGIKMIEEKSDAELKDEVLGQYISNGPDLPLSDEEFSFLDGLT